MSRITTDMGHHSTMLMKMETDAGVGDEVIRRLCEDSVFAAQTKDWWRHGGVLRLPQAEVKLLKVLGERGYFGLREWSNLFWQPPTVEEFDTMPVFPFPLRLFNSPCPFFPGKKIKDTHSVFLTRAKFQSEPATVSALVDGQKGTPKMEFDDERNGVFRRDEQLQPYPFAWHLVVSHPIGLNQPYEETAASLPEEYRGMTFSMAAFHAMSYTHLHGHKPMDDAFQAPELGMTSTPHPYGREEMPARYALGEGRPWDGDCRVAFYVMYDNDLADLVDRHKSPGTFVCRVA